MLQLLPNTDDQPPRRPAPCKLNPFLLDYWSLNLMDSFETDFSKVQAYSFLKGRNFYIKNPMNKFLFII